MGPHIRDRIWFVDQYPALWLIERDCCLSCLKKAAHCSKCILWSLFKSWEYLCCEALPTMSIKRPIWRICIAGRWSWSSLEKGGVFGPLCPGKSDCAPSLVSGIRWLRPTATMFPSISMDAWIAWRSSCRISAPRSIPTVCEGHRIYNRSMLSKVPNLAHPIEAWRCVSSTSHKSDWWGALKYIMFVARLPHG